MTPCSHLPARDLPPTSVRPWPRSPPSALFPSVLVVVLDAVLLPTDCLPAAFSGCGCWSRSSSSTTHRPLPALPPDIDCPRLVALPRFWYLPRRLCPCLEPIRTWGLFRCLLIHPTTHPPTHPPIHPSILPCIHPPTHPSTHPLIWSQWSCPPCTIGDLLGNGEVSSPSPSAFTLCQVTGALNPHSETH